MTRRLIFHLTAGMLTLAVALAAVVGYLSYAQRSDDHRNLGNQSALLGAKITQYVLERAVDNGLFDRDTLFRAQYERFHDDGTIRYRAPYDPFFARNVVKILNAFRTDDIYYAYVVNRDGFIPAHSDRSKSETKSGRTDAGSPEASTLRNPRRPAEMAENGYRFFEFRAPIIVDGQPWGEFCVGIPAALADNRGRETAAKAFFVTVALSLLIVAAMVWVIRRNLRPLQDLICATRQMAAGDTSVRCQYRGRDDLGTLASAFNAMVETISQNQEALEHRVEERTEQLREREESYRRLFDDNRAVMLQVDFAKGTITAANAAAVEFYGYPMEQLVGMPVEAINTLPRASVMAALASIRESAGSRFEFQHRLADGSIRDVEVYATFLCHGQREIYHSIIHDISDRKRMETTRLQDEQLRRSLLDNSAVGILHGSPDRAILAASARACAMFGYTLEEMQGQSFRLIHLSEEHFERFARQYTRLREPGIANIDFPFRRKDGSMIWCSAFGNRLDQNDPTKGYIWTLLDITALRDAQALARRLSRAVEQTSTSVVMTDLEGNITFVNRGFCRATGYTEEESLGKNPRIIKSGDMPAEVYREMWEKLTSGQQWRGELRNRRKNGEIFWESAVISPVKDDEGKITQYVAVKEDVTERKRAEEQLQAYAAAMEAANLALEQSNRRAEQAAQAKGEFLANMSHEIRTPMNGVLGMTDLLLDTDLSAEQRKYAEIVRFSAESLLLLINDILDLSKIEAQKLHLESLDFDLVTIVEETAEMLAVRSHEKRLRLVCLIDPNIPAPLRGDPGRLRQILINLGGNAVKFTQQGEVRIDVALKSRINCRVTVQIRVTDTGIGIPADKITGLFSPFTQVDGSTARKFGGTGLGLAICKQLAEMMGGRIGVESEEGRGSSFWCDVVLEEPPPAKAAEVETASLEGVRVLVVDDHDTNRLLLATLLKSWGCAFTEAADWGAALTAFTTAIAERRPFQVALLDMHMPDGEGADLGGKLRQIDVEGATALILMTSLGEQGSVRRLEDAGFRGVLTKPLRRSQLRRCLVSVVKGLAWPGDEAPSQPALDRRVMEIADSVRILVAEDNPVNQEVALTILRKHGFRAEAVANGREALDALEKTPYDMVLMDLQMPGMDGLEATRCIRDRSSRVLNRGIPIIAMTANAMKADEDRCREAGMDDFLAKPVQPLELLARIERWIAALGDIDAANRSQEAAQSEQPSAAAVASTAETLSLDPGQPPLRFDLLCRRVLDDRAAAVGLLRGAVDELDRSLTEIRRAVFDSNADATRQLAHRLKGLAANLSAEPLRAACSRLESAAAAPEAEALPPCFTEIEEAACDFRAAVVDLVESPNPAGDAGNQLSAQST